MLSRWDNSPPLHSGSQSPTIVIQDSSDSETDLYPDHTPSPSARSQLPTKATGETAVEQPEEPALLTTPSQRDVQTSTNLAPVLPSNSNTTEGDEQPSVSLTTTSDGLITTQSAVQTPNAQTESQEQLTLMRTVTEAVTHEECKQSASTHDDISDEHLATIDSCPEVSSSSTALIPEKPVAMNDEVSSTSESLEPISQPSSSAALANQLHSDVLPHEETSPLLRLRDQVLVSADDDDFEISLYAEDGGASLGEGSTPNSEILKKSRKDRDKSSRVSELEKKSHHHGDGHSREKERTKSGSRHSESKSSSGSGRKEYESSSSRRHKSERDKERHHRQSHHRRSRSRSHSRSRSYRSHRRDSTEEYSYSRSRHRSRSKDREHSHKRRSHRSRSRSVSRPRYSHSCSSDDNESSARIKSTVVAKNRDKDEREHRHRRERQRRDRSESQSPHRHISSHYRGEHDYERISSDYDREHRSRGRLYSDDVWSEELHSQHSSVKSVRHSTASSHSSRRKRTVHSDEEKQKPKTANETKLLAQELSEVDRQIQDNKKELLKSMLRKERLELLQKNLHGGESSVVDSMLQKSANVFAVKSTSEMEKELELLNRAITDGKKQLLKVMKKMEEEQIEMNLD